MGTPSELDDVYQSLILDHSRHPRNFAATPAATNTAHGDNPFCGDRFTVSLVLSGDRITDIGFEGAGCAISTASASMLTVRAKGLTRAEIVALVPRFDGLFTGTPVNDPELGDLLAFAAVSRFPVRVKCARLAWQTLLAALDGAAAPVSTE